MATSTIPKSIQIKTATVQATTTADGAINLSTFIAYPQILGISVKGTYHVAFLLYNNAWWAMIYTWPALQKASNVQVEVVVYYV